MSEIIAVTGAAGYVGCHCVLHLLLNGYEVVALDNCSNAVLINGQNLPESLRRVELLAKKSIKEFIFGDLTKYQVIENVFRKYRFNAVIHLAQLKSISESITNPLDYYQNNIKSVINLLEIMKKFEIFNLIFGSSAQVYGKPKYLPIDELHPTGQSLTNPYAKSVFMTEQILQDLCDSDPKWTVVSLRMFNITGAHSSGNIGEDTPTVPKSLMSYITQVAIGRRPELRVYGNDYDTIDGTGVRDYIHIEDVSDLILNVLKKMLTEKWSHWYAFNVGTGSAHSVLEVISMFESVSGISIPHELVERRVGDIGQNVSNIALSQQILSWEPKRTLGEICESALNWQNKNPKGFDDKN